MREEIKLTLSGIRKEFLGEEIEETDISLITAGKYQFNSGKHIVEYSEISENNEELFSTLTFDSKTLSIEKKGFVYMKLEFDTSKKEIECEYSMPEGAIDMKVATYEYSLEEVDDKLIIEVKYYISMGGYLISDNILRLNIESKN